MVSLLDYAYDYGYVLTTRFFTNGDFLTIRAIYIKSSNTFLPCIILFLSKLYAVDHCIMENNLKYYNEYTSVSKSFKNDAGISNYSMLFCINLLNVANTISKIVIIISSTLYAIHQFTLVTISYLDNRKQYVFYNGSKSNDQYISCGVPQGSILGPLLFILYINDLSNISESLTSILFTDDTTVIVESDSVSDAIALMNLELIKLNIWLQANKLTLNTTKTH